MVSAGVAVFRLYVWALLLTSESAFAISDVRAEPLGLEALAEVPVYFSFTTGQHPQYGLPYEDDGTVRMMVSLELIVACRPEREQCTHVHLGQNNDCSKLLEAPGLPPLAGCTISQFGTMILQLRGALEKNTRYDLLVLGTLPPAGKVIEAVKVRVLEPGNSFDILRLRSYEVAEVPLHNNGLVVRSRGNKFVTALELVSPATAFQGVALQQYILTLTGSETPFANGDQIRLYPSPFIYPDEGLSFGGPCDGFDVSGFANPLRDASCQVASVPAGDARVGYNVVVLTFGPLATLAQEPQYFRIALNTPKHMGSIGLWFAASRDAAAFGGDDPAAFNRVVPARAPFFVAPVLDVVPSMDTPEPVYGASHTLSLAIFPRLDLLGDTSRPPEIAVIPPAFFTVTSCKLRSALRDSIIAPEVSLARPGADDSHCLITLKDNTNIYAHMSISMELDVVNPSFAVGAESWIVMLKSGDGTMSSQIEFPGWPVYRSLSEAFVVPLNMEYAKWNEIQVFFRPSATTPAEPRVVVAAPYGFVFQEPCDFEVIDGFPRQGVQCSNPLSETGHNLFALRMPMMTAFEAGTAYAVNIFPVRNPYPESHSTGAEMDSLPWRIDLVSMDGTEILETKRGVPLGPQLRGFVIYPAAVLDPGVVPSVRAPNAENDVLVRFRTAARVTAHGERVLITAPHGYRWKIGAPVSVRRSAGWADTEVGTADALSREVRIAALSYDAFYPPVAEPHNQIELTLSNPDIAADTDLVVRGTILNAAIDPLLNEDVQSANVWVVELYEPGAGYLQYEFRHQAAIFPGFALQAITGGSVAPWLSFASRAQTKIMMTLRLGTVLAVSDRSTTRQLQFIGPEGFFFPADCAASRISPLHLEVNGYSHLPSNAISSCRGGGEDEGEDVERVATITLAADAQVPARVLFALLLEVVIPDALPANNTWTIRSLIGTQIVEEQRNIQGFRLSTEFISAVYHPGTVDTGEDLRVGASDNRVMFSVQPASPVEVGGELRVTAPFRFTFIRECKQSVYGAQKILNALAFEDTAGSYNDLPPIATCLGVRNVAHLTFAERLDVAIRYSFRITVSNPILPHPLEWPLPQKLWRLETFDRSGAPLQSAEVNAFTLWAFAQVSVATLAQGTGESTVVTVELQPSLTVPPYGFLLVEAPRGFTVPTNPFCAEIQLDTYGDDQRFSPLPPGTTCTRGPGGQNVAKLNLDGVSYLAAGVRFRFRIGVVNPNEPTPLRDEGEEWSIASAEVGGLGDAFLERNPAVEGYPIHERLKAFAVTPDDRLAGANTSVTVELAIHDSLGTFEVLSTTEASYLVVDMPLLFAVRTSAGAEADVASPQASDQAQPCAEFEAVYPQMARFPVLPTGCFAPVGQPTFRLRLVRNLLVGPAYTFRVGIRNPSLDAVLQPQLELVNVWQARLVRVIDRREVTFTGRSTEGYRVIPVLQHVKLVVSTPLVSVRSRTMVLASFKVVSKLAGAAQDLLQVESPPSIGILVGVDTSGSPALCQLWVARKLQPVENYKCTQIHGAGGLQLRLRGNAVIPAETEVQLDFEIDSGNQSLVSGAEDNLWTISSLNINGSTLDQAADIAGFTVFPALLQTALVPKDVSALSYSNHAEFQFQVPSIAPAGSRFIIQAPSGFALYPQTFRPFMLPVGDEGNRTSAASGSSDAEAIVSIGGPLEAFTPYAFRLTIGNGPVSPPQNTWVMRLVDQNGETLSIDPRVEGFLVESVFNTSVIEAQLDEPLAENYIHITIALGARIVADSILARSTCTATVERPVCPPRHGLQTYLEVQAPDGFSFQDTCGYWTLQRVGSRFVGLPPGSICRVHPDRQNVAQVQIAQSLEPHRLYEFTLQVRNGMSVPLDNVWQLHAVQDGVIRERDARVPGFPLRQLRTVRITPSTTLAGVVDNTITVQMRSERPVTRGAMILIVAPAGFTFDPDQVTSSFTHLGRVELQADHEDGSALRFQLNERDFAAPNTYFFVAVRVRNPPTTPSPNYWYVYVQSKYLEHIDLRKYIPGFVVAHQMYYCQVYPNSLPWNLGTENDISMLFVTKSPIFTSEDVPTLSEMPATDDAREKGWKLVLVAPVGFSFPTESKYSDKCSRFRRWGGKESYDQLPETSGAKPVCLVQTLRSVMISVPTTIVTETRYSFRLNTMVAANSIDIARQESWRLTVLHGDEILHIGEGPSPLLGTYYEAEWFWAPDGATQ